MTRPRASTKLAYPAPVQGIDFRIPITDMPPQYSPFMLNFMIQGGKLRKRHSHTVALESTTPDTTFAVICIPPGTAGSTNPIIISESEIDDGVTTNTSPVGEIDSSYDWHVFKNTLFVAGTTKAYSVNVTTLAMTAAFTYAGASSVSATSRRPITSYRERLYVARGTDLEYLGVGAVSGTPTVFSLANLINGFVCAMGTLSTSFGVGPDQYLVLASNKGDILIYSGAFPGSSDWALASKFKIDVGSLAGIGIEFISIPNDILISTQSGPQLYSLRELLASGSGAAQYTLIRPLQPVFYEIPPFNSVSQGTYCRKTCCYWPARNSLVLAIQFFATQGLETEDIPYFGAWADYIRDSFDPTSNGSCSILLFVVDLESGAITMHDFKEFTIWGQMRCNDNYIMIPNDNTAYRLFDDVTASYQDEGTEDYHAICCFAPNRALGYSTASVKNLVLYSNLVSGHTLQHGITKDFSVKPANFTTYTTSKTAKFTVTATVLPGSQQGIAFIPQIKESGHNPEPFELYGLDPIFEPGGLY